MNRRILTAGMAVAVLLVAVGLAAMGAWQRAVTPLDRALLVALSVAVVLAVHTLPALVRHWAVWPLWGVCLVVALYSHATFFALLGEAAAQDRAEHSRQSRATAAEVAQVRETLASIKARPLAQVSALLAASTDEKRIAALSIEQAEARRAAVLRDRLVALSAIQSESIALADPVTRSLSAVTGASSDAVMLTVGIATALLVELIGMALWLELLRPAAAIEARPRVQASRAHVASRAADPAPASPAVPGADPLPALRRAIEAGEVRPTVASIRQHLRCGQGKASQYRAAVLEMLGGA